MMNTRWFGTAAGLLVVTAMLGCEPTGPADPATATTPSAAAADPASPTSEGLRTYTVRGVIEQLPRDPMSQLMIAHEEIPDFVNVRGEAVGMKAMTMPFPLGEGVELTGLTVGTPVVLTFVVDWEGPKKFYVTQIAALPEGTGLVLPHLAR